MRNQLGSCVLNRNAPVAKEGGFVEIAFGNFKDLVGQCVRLETDGLAGQGRRPAASEVRSGELIRK